MPLILIAGTIVAKAKAEIFPTSDRPRCEVRIKVEGDGSAVIYRVIGFDDQTAELETCCKIHFAGFSEKRPSRVLPTMTEMTVCFYEVRWMIRQRPEGSFRRVAHA